MRLEHHLVGGYVRYISPHIIIIIITHKYFWGNRSGTNNRVVKIIEYD